MGFRFQRRIKILPGVTINLSKSGVSASLGVRGAHVTLGNGKTRTTVGIPGTGLSYTEVHKQNDHENAEEPVADYSGVLLWVIFGVVFLILLL